MKLEVIILAAGRGTRMRSPLPKVLHPLAGKPMLNHVLDTARGLEPAHIHIVVGHGEELVRAAADGANVSFHLQAEQLGTGHAVMQALPHCDPDSVVLVLFGDVPLISATALADLVAKVNDAPALLAARLDDPRGYGRVVTDASCEFEEVVEDKDASPEQRQVQDVNTGVLAAPAQGLTRWLARVDNTNAQAEYYLPDVLGLAREEGLSVELAYLDNPSEMLGVNDRLQLEALERAWQVRNAETLLRAGTAIADRQRIDVRGNLQCGEGVSIDVNAVIEGDVALADGVSVGANCFIRNATIGADTDIQPFSHIDSADIGRGCRIGPYARIRPDTALEDEVRIGNFVETKKSRFARGSKANHLAYVGDASVGAGTNIGAGTITCNYDGVNKHQTIMGDGVFVGSNSTLVAPVEIADGSFVAAGSTITKTVGAEELAVGRSRQRNLTGWKKPEKPS